MFLSCTATNGNSVMSDNIIVISSAFEDEKRGENVIEKI